VTRRQPTMFNLDPAVVDALDDVARGLGIPRSRVAEAYMIEALESRCLWPRPAEEPAPETSAQATVPPSPSDTGAARTRLQTPARAASKQTRNHPWNKRAGARRDPSLRGRDGSVKG
jgi:hypothetical protein